jgi:hypothetical protein
MCPILRFRGFSVHHLFSCQLETDTHGSMEILLMKTFLLFSSLLLAATAFPLVAFADPQPRTKAGQCGKDAGAPYNPSTRMWYPPADWGKFNKCINAIGLADRAIEKPRHR